MALTIPHQNINPLFELAYEYHNLTETYDRSVCTGPIRDGSVLPATDRERHLIEKHARSVREVTRRKAEEMGFNKQLMYVAIRQVGKTYSHEQPIEHQERNT